MKKTITTLSLFLAFFSNAQDLPQASPKAKLEQRIGLTDVTVVYHRPSVKDRVVFGDLVPYNEVWRAGANTATLITFTDNVEIEGNDLAAGTYALYITPTEQEWQIHFNTATDSWGTNSYKAENNALSISVSPTKAPFKSAQNRPNKLKDSTNNESGPMANSKAKKMNPMMKNNFVETMRFSFDNITATTADLSLAWETTTVTFSIKVDAHKKALDNIEKAIKESSKDNLWKVYRNSANYMFQGKHDINQALTWVNKSIELNDTSWFSFWLKAQILAEKGEKSEAKKNAEKALEMGKAEAKKNNTKFNYEETINKAIESWK